MTDTFGNLEFTATFLASLLKMRPNVGELEAIFAALAHLDADPVLTVQAASPVPGHANVVAISAARGVRLLCQPGSAGTALLLVAAREHQD